MLHGMSSTSRTVIVCSGAMRRLILAGCLSVLLLFLSACSKSAQSYLSSADQHYSAGRFDAALHDYRKALEKDSALGEAAYGFGLSALELNRSDEAFLALRRASALLPNRTDIKVKLADVSLAAYQSDPRSRSLYDLFAELTNGLLAKERSFDALRLKGNLLLLDRKPQEAIEYYRAANEQKPGQEYVIVGYVQALLATGRASEAEAAARDLIARKKTFIPIYDVLYRHYRSLNQDSAAEMVLNELIRNNPSDIGQMIRLATHHAAARNVTGMDRVLEELVAKGSKNWEAYLLAGDFMAARRDYERAVSTYTQGTMTQPSHADEYEIRIAAVRLDQNRIDDALKTVGTVLTRTPGSEAALTLKADCLMKRAGAGDYDSAVSVYESVRKMRPDDATLLVKLGRAHLAKNATKPARVVLQEALHRDQRLLDAKVALASVNLLEKKPAEAVRYTDEVLNVVPERGDARYLAVVALMELGRNDEARVHLASLSKQFPKSRDIQLLRGVLSVMSRRYAEAEEIFGSINSASSDLRAISGLADAYVGQQQYDRALKMLEAESGRSPQSNKVRLLLANTALKAGQHERAIAELNRLAQAVPGSVDVITALGHAYREAGRFDEAAEQFRKLKQEGRGDAESSLLVGFTMHQAGRPADAIAHYRKALAVAPANPVVMNNLAYALAEAGGQKALEEAFQLSQRAARLHPNEPDIKDTLGWVYLKRGMTTEALQIFDELCKAEPKHPSYRYHLGLALMADRNKSGAKKAFSVALSNKPSGAEALLIKRALQEVSLQP